MAFSLTPPALSQPSYLVGSGPAVSPAPAGGIGVGSTAPDAAVFFYPYNEERDQDASDDELQDTTEVVAHSEIMSLSTSKPKGDAGHFSIVLSPTRDWLTLLAPGTWCCIYIKAGQVDVNSPDGLKMVGVVKSVRRQEVTAEGGRKVVRYVVGGLDFHCILNSQIYINPGILSANGTTNTYLTLGQAVTKANQSPADVVEALFDAILGVPLNLDASGNLVPAAASTVNSPILVPPALASRVFGYPASNNRFTSFLVRYLQATLLGTNIQIPQAGNTTSFWSMAEAYSNRVVNEIYTDLMPVLNDNGTEVLAPSFILRAKPFSTQDRYPDASCIGYLTAAGTNASTPTAYATNSAGISTARRGDQTYWASRYVGDQEIIAIDQGKGDQERFNLFFVTATVTLNRSQDHQQLLLKTIQNGNNVHRGSQGRHGTRPFVSSSEYLLGSGAAGNIDLINRIAIDMWQDAYLWQNGSVTLPGTTAHVPVGSAIIFQDRGAIAHVESVDNNFDVVDAQSGKKQFRQRIAFSRMQRVDGQGALNMAGMADAQAPGTSTGTDNIT